VTEPVGPSRTSRRAELRRQRRRRRVRLVAALVGVLALLAATFAVYLAQDDQTPPPSELPVARTQSTLLLQVQGPNGAAAASALLAHDPEDKTGSALLIPPQVLVTVPGTGSLPFGRALATVPPQGSRDALSDLIGVTIDDGWVVTVPLLAQLVDAFGGIPVEVDVPVVRGDTVVVSPGAQNLDGARATEFLLYLAPDEQEQARLARVQEVLDGLINVLPRDSAELVQHLQVLGDRSVTTMELPELADFLLGLAVADEAGQQQYDTLPVIPIDPGGGVTAFRVDEARVNAVVDRLMAESVPPGVREGGNRVLVLNGVGTPGLGEAVRAKLVPAGFVFVDSRNADRFGYAETQVLVPEATAEAQQLGERVAEALGVPATSVKTQDFGTVADVIVLVGADFSP
jgi:anionic cell wall polymer biosynthesis LytR-Cps2A-Psr (LCP) family protein